MMPKKTSLRERILEDQALKRNNRNQTELLTGELGDACQEAREMYRAGEIKSVNALWKFLQKEYGYPYGRSAFENFLYKKAES